MTNPLRRFESVVRKTKQIEADGDSAKETLHPFDERNIHPEIGRVAKMLFDNGHYAQATFEAFKYLDNQVQKISDIKDSGHSLMMNAFNEKKPSIQLTMLATGSEIDEQLGFRFMFAGAASGIRNPRGHDVNLPDTIDLCLDHLSIASVLMRKLEARVAPT